MTVVPLDEARPAGWLTEDRLAELRRPYEGTRLAEQEIHGADEARREALRRIAAGMDIPAEVLDDMSMNHWMMVDRELEPLQEPPATWDAQRDLRRASNQVYGNPDAGPVDPEGAGIMTMHALAPDDGGPMRTSCCGRLLEDLPATEGVLRNAGFGQVTCPRR